MLVAGRSAPTIGGGKVLEPMRLVLGDRASSSFNAKQIDIAGIVEAAVRDRVNGVIPLNRPISNEAAAGKNPVSHVGKIYSLLTHHIANEVVQRVEGVDEVYVWLCSQIGQPINKPMLAASHVVLRSGVGLPDVEPAVKAIIEQDLAGIHKFSLRIIRGEFSVW